MGTNLDIVITSECGRDGDTYTADALLDVWRDYALYGQIHELTQHRVESGVKVSIPGSNDETVNDYVQEPYLFWVSVADLAKCDPGVMTWNQAVWAFLRGLSSEYVAYLWWS